MLLLHSPQKGTISNYKNKNGYYCPNFEAEHMVEKKVIPMKKPVYCPNCGMKLTDALIMPFTELIFNHREKDEIIVPAKGWGVECINCEWSGEISPDIK